MSKLAVLHASNKQTWRTPEPIIRLVRQVGPISLDPCADRDPANYFAINNFSAAGLTLPWADLTLSGSLAYCNPPYGSALKSWAEKMAIEGEQGVQLISLVPARTDTKWWLTMWNSCQAVVFWTGRIKFVGAPNSAPFPSAFFYWGNRRHLFADVFEPHSLVVMRREKLIP